MKNKASYIVTAFSRTVSSTFFAALMFALASCTGEKLIDEGTDPPVTPADPTPRREVLMTLKNKLAVRSANREAISTTEENTISTLDVYVFGSYEENGTYTFQERFSYRDDESGPIPEGAAELHLTNVDNTTTTGVLSLKRGLFVKLYCVANSPILTDADTRKEVEEETYFKPVEFNEAAEPAEGGSPIKAEGSPKEEEFLKLCTPLLAAGTDKDGSPVTASRDNLLLTPPAMSGACTTPLDLTDLTSAARLQTGFKLTRLVARFDIVNNAETSKFTLRSVSMSNGRKGATFFPIAVYGSQPSAGTDELITYVPRPFAEGEFAPANANQGKSTGAFYCYPSPVEDNGYLILKGTYQTNLTESKDVTYQVPFIQKNAADKGTVLEINHNHRYTLSITDADKEHLDFTLDVADWNDEGSVDDYTPENNPGEMIVTIPKEYADETEDMGTDSRGYHTVEMTLRNGNNFNVTIPAVFPLAYTGTYVGDMGGHQYEWLKITEVLAAPEKALTSTDRTYNISLNTAYQGTRYPRAVFRFFDRITGSETVVFVDAVGVPLPVKTEQPAKAPNGISDNPNSFIPAQDGGAEATATLYRITGSEVKVKINCKDPLIADNKPSWLDVDFSYDAGESRSLCTLTLNDREAEVDGDTYMLTIQNQKKEYIKVDIAVQLKDALMKPDFTGITGLNAYEKSTDTAPDNIVMTVNADNTFTIPVESMGGIELKELSFESPAPAWLKCEVKGGSAAGNTLVFTLDRDNLTGAKKATVVLKNIIGGCDHTFTVTPKLASGTMVHQSSFPADNVISADGNTLTFYKLDGNESAMNMEVTSYGGSVLTSAEEDILKVSKTTATFASAGRTAGTPSTENETATVANYTLTALQPGTTVLTLTNYTDPSDTPDTKTYTVHVIQSDISVAKGTTSIAAGGSVEMPLVNGGATEFVVTSGKGVKEAVVNWASGDNQWFDVSLGEFKDGKQTLTLTQKDNTDLEVKEVTLTLTNNIAVDPAATMTFTVKPANFPAPTVTPLTTQSPTQNTMSGTAISLYQVDASSFSFKASAVGGDTEFRDKTGAITITESGTAPKTYTVKLDSKTSSGGTFYVANKSDKTNTSKILITVTSKSAAITVADKSVTAAVSGNTPVSIQAPEGCGITLESYANGGGKWFNFPASVTKENTSFNITQLENNYVTKMTATRLKLTNNIKGAPVQYITITPINFAAPTIVYQGAKEYLDNLVGNDASQWRVVTITGVAGGCECIPSDANIVRLSLDSRTGSKLIFKLIANAKGDVSLTFRNASDPARIAGGTREFNVRAAYDGGPVYQSYGSSNYYIAPSDASASITWIDLTSSANSNICSKYGAGWRVPTLLDLNRLIDKPDDSHDSKADQAVYDYYKNNGIFVIDEESGYWSTTLLNDFAPYYLYFEPSYACMFVTDKRNSRKVRCVCPR